MKKAIFVGTVLGIVLLTTVAHAQRSTYQAFIENILESKIKTWLQEPAVIDSIKTQNSKNVAWDQDEIKRLDDQWQTERRSKEQPFIEEVCSNPLSMFLKEVKANNEGLFSEIFVMDNKGLNVGQSDPTSDYWQGDEAKWQQTYLAGPEGLLIGERKFDESANKFLIQVSVSVVDPATQEAIGAVTVGVSLVQLMRGATVVSSR